MLYQTSLSGNPRVNTTQQLRIIVIRLAIVLMLMLFNTQAIQAQTFSVIHYFTGGADGGNPYAGLTIVPSGTLYGTASEGGADFNGTVFKLNQVDSRWVLSPLYEFAGFSDGIDPLGGIVIGPNGGLYGTTDGGGAGYGTVFELSAPATFCRSVLCYWNDTVLYAFTGPPDGQTPAVEYLAFDQAGDIYGTTDQGGTNNEGIAFELTPSSGGYTESILHSFGSGADGAYPYSGVVLDASGNVYGTTIYGGTGGAGTVYQLAPSNGGWVENVLVNFDVTNGENPVGNLTIDSSGNLYGTTGSGGQNGDGVVYKLTPSDGGLTYSVLYSFSSCESAGGITMDMASNLFGVCFVGGAHQYGWIFELTNCSTRCIVTDLHDFSGSDGRGPHGTPVFDANGNLYGTTLYGGTRCSGFGCGVVWEIAGVGGRRR